MQIIAALNVILPVSCAIMGIIAIYIGYNVYILKQNPFTNRSLSIKYNKCGNYQCPNIACHPANKNYCGIFQDQEQCSQEFNITCTKMKYVVVKDQNDGVQNFENVFVYQQNPTQQYQQVNALFNIIVIMMIIVVIMYLKNKIVNQQMKSQQRRTIYQNMFQQL